MPKEPKTPKAFIWIGLIAAACTGLEVITGTFSGIAGKWFVTTEVFAAHEQKDSGSQEALVKEWHEFREQQNQRRAFDCGREAAGDSTLFLMCIK